MIAMTKLFSIYLKQSRDKFRRAEALKKLIADEPKAHLNKLYKQSDVQFR